MWKTTEPLHKGTYKLVVSSTLKITINTFVMESLIGHFYTASEAKSNESGKSSVLSRNEQLKTSIRLERQIETCLLTCSVFLCLR